MPLDKAENRGTCNFVPDKRLWKRGIGATYFPNSAFERGGKQGGLPIILPSWISLERRRKEIVTGGASGIQPQSSQAGAG